MLAQYLIFFGIGVIRFFVRVQMRLAFDEQLKPVPVYMQTAPNQQNFHATLQKGSGVHTGIAVHAGIGATNESLQQQQCNNKSQLQILPIPLQPYVDIGLDVGSHGHNLRNRINNIQNN